VVAQCPSAAFAAAVGPTGILSQWLVLGPFAMPRPASRRAAPDLTPALLKPLGGPGALKPGTPVRVRAFRRCPRKYRWRLHTQKRTWMDLKAISGVKPLTRHLGAVLGTELVVTRPSITAWLSLGTDDACEVWLNGKKLFADLTPKRFRPDQFLIRLPLKRGRNRLIIWLAHPKGRWRAFTRFTGPDHRPLGRGASRGAVRICLPATRIGPAAVSPAALRAMAAASITFYVKRTVKPTGVAFRLAAKAAGGIMLPASRGLDLKMLAVPKKPFRRKPGVNPIARITLPLKLTASSFASGISVNVSKILPVGQSARLEVTVEGKRRFRTELRGRKRICNRLARTRSFLSAARARTNPAMDRSSLDTVEFHANAVQKLLEAGDRDGRYLYKRLGWAFRWAKSLAAGRDPFPRARGRIVKAYRSKLDGSLQPYSLWVPVGYTRRRRWPLYVMLHGMGCHHRKGINQMLGTWMPEKDPLTWKKFTRRLPRPAVTPQAIVLAPEAFGDSFYRHAGELDVLRTLKEVLKRYRINRRKIILVGHSMGGTGVLEIGFRYPHLFAGVVPLAGYPTRWLIRAVRRGPLRPWERFIAHTLSPQMWARNGLYLPMIAVDGTKDGPHKSKGMVDTYKRLGYPAQFRLFEYGHSTWRLYMDKGQVYSDTARWIRPRTVRRIRYRTTRLRWNRAYWIRLDSRPRSNAWTRVDARIRRFNRVTVRTQNLDGLSLFLKRPPGGPAFGPAIRRVLKPNQPVKIRVDGQTLTVPFGPVITLRKTGTVWKPKGASYPVMRRLKKTPGREGPIDDFFYGPVMVVYGTRAPGETAAYKRVARLASRFRSSGVRYPVKADTAVTGADVKKHNLLLVGGPWANAVTRRLHNRLPIKISRSAITVGRCRYTGRDTGVVFIYPNPDAPGRYILVVAGTTAAAVLRARWLPHYLPDYAVFNQQISRITNFRILGPTRKFLNAGFFDRRWRLKPAACKRSSR
jgi:pimeloyl-ACP methyl ester carboxylesterase